MNDPSAKSFSICCRRPVDAASVEADGRWRAGFGHRLRCLGLQSLGLWLCCLILSVGAASGLKKPVEVDDIFNPLLGVEHSHWLVGPIYHLATAAEVKEYLDLVSDEDAAAFVEQFWQRQNADTPVFQDTPQDLFDKRSEEANKRYSENAFPGQRSDRGTIYILYGEPESVTYESPRNVGDRTVEVWSYAKDAAKGLDGERPKKTFRFVEIDGSTVFFTGQQLKPRDRLRRRNSGF